MIGSSLFRSVRLRALLSSAFVALALVAATASAQAGTTVTMVPAHSGHAWQPADSTCFSNPSFSNGIQNTCSFGSAWLTPLPLQVTAMSGSFWVNLSWYAGIKSTGGSAPNCRVIVQDTTDSSVYFGSATNITSSSIPLGGPATINALFDTQHLDCWFNASPTQELTYFQGQY